MRVAVRFGGVAQPLDGGVAQECGAGPSYSLDTLGARWVGLVDWLVMRRYLAGLIRGRAAAIARVAEGG
ncbi:MAG: hypothetical protein U0821_00845 [Chloroflexota bacterium]